MKRLLLIASCFVSLIPSGRAAPEDDVDAAIEKLLSTQNFAWMVNWSHVEPGSRFRYEGITEPLGATMVRLDRHGLRKFDIPDGDRPVTVVFIGERAVVELDRVWLIPRELGRFGFVPSADEGMIVPGTSSSSISPDRRTTKTAVSGSYIGTQPGYIYLPRVDLILRILRGQLENAKRSGGETTADLSHKAASALFALKLALPQVDVGTVTMGEFTSTSTVRSSKPQDGPPSSEELLAKGGRANLRPRPSLFSEQFHGAKGTATFWIDRGGLVKFELQLEAIGVFQGASRIPEQSHEVVMAVTIENVGASNVEIPAGARQRLAIP